MSKEDTVKATISKYFYVPSSELKLDTRLADLGADSLDWVELMAALNIPDALAPKLVTVGDLIEACN